MMTAGPSKMDTVEPIPKKLDYGSLQPPYPPSPPLSTTMNDGHSSAQAIATTTDRPTAGSLWSRLTSVLIFLFAASIGLINYQIGNLNAMLVGFDVVADTDDSSDQEVLPTWTVLPWHPQPNPPTTNSNVTGDYFIGYMQLCEISWRDGQSKLVYQVASVNGTSNNNGTGTPSSCNLAPSSLAAPLIRMTPGNHYTLILINNANEPTNLHTHGLHISGVRTVDDVTRSVPPGQCLVYQYYIANDADVGTFWYHSHLYPLAAKQVSRGAFGPLIVDETAAIKQSFYPPHLQAFFRHEIVLQYASILHRSAKTRIVILNGLVWEEAIHGQSSPSPLLNLTLIRHRWYYLRISFMILSDPVNFWEFSPADACEIRIVAYDGVYRSRVPSEFRVTQHMMTTSSRVDVAVRCHAPTAALHFYQDGDALSNRTRLVQIETVEENTMAAVRNVEPSPFWNAAAETQWKPRRSYYMQNLLSADATNNATSKSAPDIWQASMDDLLKNGTVALSSE